MSWHASRAHLNTEIHPAPLHAVKLNKKFYICVIVVMQQTQNLDLCYCCYAANSKHKFLLLLLCNKLKT